MKIKNMEAKKIERRGGARKGAGRPPIGADKRERLTIFLHPTVAEKYRHLRKEGKIGARFFEEAVERLYRYQHPEG